MALSAGMLASTAWNWASAVSFSIGSTSPAWARSRLARSSGNALAGPASSQARIMCSAPVKARAWTNVSMSVHAWSRPVSRAAMPRCRSLYPQVRVRRMSGPSA